MSSGALVKERLSSGALHIGIAREPTGWQAHHSVVPTVREQLSFDVLHAACDLTSPSDINDGVQQQHRAAVHGAVV